MPDFTQHATQICLSSVNFSTTIQGSKKAYRVTFGFVEKGPFEHDWSCDCDAFKFRRKSSVRTCKHVEQAKRLRCGWNETMELVSHHEACPQCSGPLKVMEFAV